MKKYKISVTRIGYAFTEVEVEAETDEEAKNLAIEKAIIAEMSECSSEYQIDWMYFDCPYCHSENIEEDYEPGQPSYFFCKDCESHFD